MSADDEHHRRGGEQPADRRWHGHVALALALLVVAGSGRAVAAPTFTWTPELVYEPAPGYMYDKLGFSDVSCTAPSLCVAVTLDGQVHATTDLAAGPAAWTAYTPTAEGSGLLAVSCVPALCIAGGAAGRLLASVDAGAPAPTWSQVATAPDDVPAVSCPTASFCVAVDRSGDVLSSTAPAEPGSWRTVPVDGESLEALACPSASLCVALDQSGELVTSTAPGGGPEAWRIELLPGEPQPRFTSLTCPSDSLCFALDGDGNVYATNAPAEGAHAWHVGGTAGIPSPMDLTCTSEQRCFAYNQYRSVATSDLPLDGAAAWSSTALGGELELTGTACLSAARCVIVSSTGHVIVGDAPPPLGNVRVMLFGEGEGTIVAPGLACTTMCDGTYTRGTRLTLTPSAGIGSVFSGWGGDCQGLGPCEITVGPATMLTAGFTPGPPPLGFRLSVSIAGDGSVHGGGIACPDACESTRPPGTIDELVAAADPGWHLDGWFGACAGQRCRLRASRDNAASAQFLLGAVEIVDARIRAAAGRARFAFRSSLPRVGTRCALARARRGARGRPRPRWRACRSPVAYAHLAPGRYVFSARAARAGDPATRKPFQVR